jgi:hypothetical protein
MPSEPVLGFIEAVAVAPALLFMCAVWVGGLARAYSSFKLPRKHRYLRAYVGGITCDGRALIRVRTARASALAYRDEYGPNEIVSGYIEALNQCLYAKSDESLFNLVLRREAYIRYLSRRPPGESD